MALSNYQSRAIAVFGLGRSGRSAARALLAGGADVRAWDDDATQRDAARAQGVPLADLGRGGWEGVAALVLAPGVPLHFPKPHPVVALARAHGVPIIGDVELFLSNNPRGKIVGVTGTNGKSTTTALIGHVLRQAGREAAVGGNIGVPVLDLEAAGDAGVTVIEMSSYQLELTPSWRADVAVLLNITPDHLDRHGNMENYVAAKRHIFDAAKVAVVGTDDAHGRKIFSELAVRGRSVVAVSFEQPKPGAVSVWQGKLYADGDAIADFGAFTGLPGRHNGQNAAAAFAALRALGLDAAAIVKGLASFPGLAHRLERVGRLQGVDFVNDSKATNAAASAKALACFDRIYWIAGGRAKSDGLAGLDQYYSRIRHAFLIGEAAPSFAATLAGQVPCTHSGTLDLAVPAAFRQAQDDNAKENAAAAVVLLSPACASFDQFKDFEARGDRFRDLVAELAGRAGAKSNGAAA